jgi:hypothetical protein
MYSLFDDIIERWWKLVGRCRSLGTCSKRVYLVLSAVTPMLSLFADYHEGGKQSSMPHTPCTMTFSLASGPKQWNKLTMDGNL